MLAWIFGTHPRSEVTVSTLHQVFICLGLDLVLLTLPFVWSSGRWRRLVYSKYIRLFQSWGHNLGAKRKLSVAFEQTWSVGEGCWGMHALGYRKGTSLVVLLIRNNEGKEIKSCCLLTPIQRDIDQLKLLKVHCQIISSP